MENHLRWRRLPPPGILAPHDGRVDPPRRVLEVVGTPRAGPVRQRPRGHRPGSGGTVSRVIRLCRSTAACARASSRRRPQRGGSVEDFNGRFQPRLFQRQFADRAPCVDGGLAVACDSQTTSRTCPLIARSQRRNTRRNVAVLRAKVGGVCAAPPPACWRRRGTAARGGLNRKSAAYRISKHNSCKYPQRTLVQSRISQFSLSENCPA